MDYTDECDMSDLYVERYGRDPTGEELADFMADFQAELGDRLHDQMRDRGVP